MADPSAEDREHDARLGRIERRVDELHNTVTGHTSQIAVLNAQLPNLTASIERNTQAVNQHASTLNEYKGAQKIVHWLITAGVGLVSYFFGTNGGKS